MSRAPFSDQTVIFRADASLEIGSGHVMRCLTLADGLTARGAKCHFICRDHSGNLIGRIKDRGYTVHILQIGNQSHAPGAYASSKVPSQPEAQMAHRDWLGATQDEDAAQCASILQECRPDWLVVDHYALDARWERIAKPEYTRLLAIDDLTDRTHLADLLLDQNLGRHAEDYASLVPETCLILTGPSFALLRPEFAELRDESLQRRASPRLQQLLISMGGVDKDNATGKVLEILKSCPLPEDCRISIIMSGQAPWLGAVKAQAVNMPWPTEVVVDAQDMARRMTNADLAIGAGGGTSWERCCLGLPALIVVLAENQWTSARALALAGAAELIGTVAELDDALAVRFEALSKSNALLRISRAAAEVTDGWGLMRVCDLMQTVET